MVDDLQILVLRRRGVVDDEAEAVRQGNGFVLAVVAVYLVQIVAPVAPRFLEQVAAVRRGVDDHVIRLWDNAAVDDRFQVFVFLFVLVEGQVVEKEDELLALDGAEMLHERRQLLHLPPLDLDEAQALLVKFVHQSLDGRRFPRAAGARQEDVVGLPPFDEIDRIAQELFLLYGVADEVVPFAMAERLDAFQLP